MSYKQFKLLTTKPLAESENSYTVMKAKIYDVNYNSTSELCPIAFKKLKLQAL